MTKRSKRSLNSTPGKYAIMSGKKQSIPRAVAAGSDSEHEGCSNCSHLTEVVENLRQELKELKEALAKPDVVRSDEVRKSEMDEWRKEVEKKIDDNRERIESRTNRQLTLFWLGGG